MNSLFYETLTLLLGFTLMIFGADRLVKGAIQIATTLNLPKSFVGAVLIGLGTSAPELFTSFYSAAQGEGLLAAGNVIGSNIFNSTLVMSACLLFPFSLTKEERHWTNWIFILLPGTLIYIFLLDLKLTSFEGLALLSPLPVFFYLLIKREPDSKEEHSQKNKKIPYTSFLWGGLGVALLYIGTKTSIEASLNIVNFFGLSKSFAGTVILAAGTGLPELVTTIVAGFKKELSLALGNILGSNMLNASGVLGGAALFFPFSISEKMAFINAPYLLIISIFLIPLLVIKHRFFPKIWAVFLLLLYSYFIAQA